LAKSSKGERWERGLRLEASERLYVMRSGQQSVLDAAQRRLSGAVAEVVSMARFGQKQKRWMALSGQQWMQPKAMKARWERGLRLEASERLYVMQQRTAVGPGCSPEKTVRRRG
jgi:hypothetical protein